MDTCLICSVVALSTSRYVVYEDEYCCAFLENSPDTTGHTVVALKKHAASIEDYSSVETIKLIDGIQAAVRRLTDALQPEGYNVGWNQGQAAGQLTPHLHVHVLPRWNGDGGGTIHSIISRPAKPPKDIALLLK